MRFISKGFIIQFLDYSANVINRLVPFQYIVLCYEYGEGLCLLPVIIFVLWDAVGIKYTAVTCRALRYCPVVLPLDFGFNMPAIGILGIYIKAEAVLGEFLVFLWVSIRFTTMLSSSSMMRMISCAPLMLFSIQTLRKSSSMSLSFAIRSRSFRLCSSIAAPRFPALIIPHLGNQKKRATIR